MIPGQFGSLRASSLYCAPCGNAQPVIESLVGAGAGRELYHYLCAHCGHLVGTREVKGRPNAPLPADVEHAGPSEPPTPQNPQNPQNPRNPPQ